MIAYGGGGGGVVTYRGSSTVFTKQLPPPMELQKQINEQTFITLLFYERWLL